MVRNLLAAVLAVCAGFSARGQRADFPVESFTKSAYEASVVAGWASPQYGEFGRVFLETVHGARIDRHVFVGAGLAIQYAYSRDIYDYYGYRTDFAIMPLFATVRVYIPLSLRTEMFLHCDAGYTAGLWNTEGWGGGFYFAAGPGFAYRRLTLGIGLMHQSLGADMDNIDSFYIKLGVRF